MEDDYLQNDVDKDFRRGIDRRSDRGKRRDRKPRERLRQERDRSDFPDISADGENVSIKTPILLAKKNPADPMKRDIPTILGIQKRGGYEQTSSPTSTKTLFTETYNRPNKPAPSTTPSPATPTKPTQLAGNSSESTVVTGVAALKLSNDILLTESISLIDGNFNWSDKAFECLLDQTDYVVVGCVGLQGAGKSTIMSMLAGQKIESIEKTRLVFRPQKKADLEKCSHRTVGMDIYVTQERLILLDTQPLLSSSMLDQYLRHDRKVPSEYATAELCLEVQALQMLSFLYTVCHVVLVIQDHFTDLHLINLLKTAEMLKPSTVSSSSQDGTSSHNEEYNEHYPYICFLFTCCADRSFEADVVHSMCEVLSKVFDASRLRVRGSASIIRLPVLPYCYSNLFYDFQDFNLFLLPEMNNPNEGNCPISKYQGHLSLQALATILRQQLCAMPRKPFTHHILSEKNWFHFAARTWETVKKSNLIIEYHRLLAT